MKGTYILTIELKRDLRMKIGKLGSINFLKGYYCYVGSALGKSVNLENRIGRHKRLNREKSGKLHWHIDYFLVNPNVDILRIDEINSNKRMECKISQRIEQAAEYSIHNFGCSDCNCKSHFHYFKNRNFLDKGLKVVKHEDIDTNN